MKVGWRNRKIYYSLVGCVDNIFGESYEFNLGSVTKLYNKKVWYVTDILGKDIYGGCYTINKFRSLTAAKKCVEDIVYNKCQIGLRCPISKNGPRRFAKDNCASKRVSKKAK